MNEAKKLRALVPACDDPTDYTEDDCVMLDAADHIEALERALLKIACLYDDTTADAHEVYVMSIARAALSPTPER